MIRSAKIVLSLGAVLIAAGVANAAPKESAADGKVCQAGVGKAYVMPLFSNGKAVSACEVGNAGFFSKSCAQPSKAALASSGGSDCCAGEKGAAHAKVAAHALPAGHPKVAAGQPIPAGHPKVAGHGCGEMALGVMACEVGNRHFFTAASCDSSAKVAKASCCSAK